MRGECTPEQKMECPLAHHFTDEHHLYFPRSDYKQPVEKSFRNLPDNTVQLCRNEHNELHATEEPPEKPSIQYMAESILRSEVHMSRKVSAQVADVMQRQQEVINQYWRTAEARR